MKNVEASPDHRNKKEVIRDFINRHTPTQWIDAIIEIEMSIVCKRPVPVSVLRDELVSNYPYWDT